MMFRYRLKIEPDDNGTVLVTSPDLPIATYGDNEAAALRHAVDAALAVLSSMIEAREDIPVAPTTTSGDLVLRLPLQIILKLSLYVALRSRNMTRADLQRKLGWQRESIDRLFRLDHKSKVEQLNEAFSSLDMDVTVDLVDRGAAKAA